MIAQSSELSVLSGASVKLFEAQLVYCTGAFVEA